LRGRLEVDPAVEAASTLPADLVRDPAGYDLLRERVLARAWHVVDPVPSLARDAAHPTTLLPGCLDEPLVLTKDEVGREHLLSNVCTHRGKVVCEAPVNGKTLRCGYHGRSFHLDGRLRKAPAFEGAQHFPAPSDDLPTVPTATLGPLRFASVSPAMSFQELLGPFAERLAFVPWDRCSLVETRDYEVDASFMLYCDNYLEGLHIPFVHEGLMETLDFGAYEVELGLWSSLQIGIAKNADDALVLPPDHVDASRPVAAFYLFLFPCTMINVYPWGVSVNAVRPLGPAKTRVTYLTFVHSRDRLGIGAGADLHRVELEDQAVVTSVQRGIRSRFYERGRFSPSMERGVHHFHRALASLL
jgi:choline monooxygenase